MKGIVALLIALALAAQGCTYAGNRARDFADTMDLGFTLSSRPQFAIYACAFGLAGLGYGHLDGKVLGLFGGRVGLQPMKADVWSAGPIGGQTIQYGDAAPIKQCTGAVCILKKTPDGMTKSSSCCHYLHLGFLGLAGNLHYKEIADFALGFFGADICKDDRVRSVAPRSTPLWPPAGDLLHPQILAGTPLGEGQAGF
jgi:hypothetical protein